MNRQIRCIDCDVPTWVPQASWRKLKDKWGSRAKIRHRFRCRGCKKLEKDKPFEYQIRYGKPIKALRKKLQCIYLDFRNDHGKLEELEHDVNTELLKYNTPPEFAKYHIDDKSRLLGITIDSVFILGEKFEVYIPLFTPKEYNKKWEIEKQNKKDGS